MAATARQIGAIHALKKRSGMDDETYRAVLKQVAGVGSSKSLTTADAGRVIERLKTLAGQPISSRGAAETVTGQHAPILQALWMAAHNLGLARSRDDKALIAFVKRVTGQDHPRFLNPQQANRAIEGLKGWMKRDGGVNWETDDAKREVCRAITARLVALGGFTSFIPGDSPWPRDIEAYGYRDGLPPNFSHYTGAHWDRLANRLGARLRAVLAKQTAVKNEP